MNEETELYHHGVKGQKWGVRNYQNEDGSLTEEGKERYLDPKTGKVDYNAILADRESAAKQETQDKADKEAKAKKRKLIGAAIVASVAGFAIYRHIKKKKEAASASADQTEKDAFINRLRDLDAQNGTHVAEDYLKGKSGKTAAKKAAKEVVKAEVVDPKVGHDVFKGFKNSGILALPFKG
jgi:hypothetical protein